MKPPAFQFYADDFLAGTFDMTPREVGVFIIFLCIAWSKGSLPNDEKRLFVIARTNNEPTHEAENEAAVRYVVAEKFVVCEDGRLRNERLETVRSENSAWREKSIIGGKMSAAKRVGDKDWGKKMAEKRATQRATQRASIEPPIEPTTNSPSPSPSPKTIKRERTAFVKPTLEEVKMQCAKVGLPESEADAFHSHHEARGWAYKQGSMKSWVAALNSWKINFDRGTFAPTNGSPSRNTPKSLARPAWAVLRDLKEEEESLAAHLYHDWERAAAPEKVARLAEVRNSIVKIHSRTEAAPVESVR